jgi:neutral ceramidase
MTAPRLQAVAPLVVLLSAIGFALGGQAPAVAAEARTQDRTPARTVLITVDQRSLLSSGTLRLRLRYPRVGRVRVFTRLGRSLVTRPPVALTRARSLAFRRPGRRTVGLRLTRAGRAALRASISRCRALRFSVVTRSRKRFMRTSRTLKPGPRCRGESAPDAAPGSGPPGGAAPGGTGGGGPGGPAPALRAGAATSDITPPVGTPMFAYTSRSAVANPLNAPQVIADPDENLYAKTFVPSEGIHARVQSRALVLERNAERHALVQVDLGGIPYDLVQEVLARIDGTGVAPDRLLISATHTHSSTGPIWPQAGYGALGGDIFDPRIFELTAESIAESIRGAVGQLQAAEVGIGTAQLDNASRNRNFEPFRLNEDVPEDEAQAREQSIDPQLTAIRVDTPGGSPIALWSNFAIHQTSFGGDNLLFSGDNASTAVRVADAAIADQAGTAPVTLFTNAAEGDISPNGGPDNPDGEPLQYTPTSAASANLAGRRLGHGIVRAWREAGDEMRPDLALAARRTFVAMDGSSHGDAPRGPEPVGPIAHLGQGGIVAPDGTCTPVDRPDGQGRKVTALGGVGLVPQSAPVSLWRIGSLGIVGYPLEMTKQVGKRITDRLTEESGGAFADTVIAGLSNGYQSYTATPEEYDACHYEGSFTLFGRQQSGRYLNATLPLVGPLMSGVPADEGIEPPQSGEGTPDSPPVRSTPDAGEVVAEPAETVVRGGRADFRWKGGDPTVDAPRGAAFVALQYEEAPGEFRTVATEEGVFDTTAFDDSDDSWIETWQFTECDRIGRYRFAVTGMASRGPGAAPEAYEVTSRPFQLQPIPALEVIDSQVTGDGTARVRARYPDPGPALVALPRRVRDGTAQLTVRTDEGPSEVTARPDDARLAFEAEVEPGTTIEGVDVQDACGNG